ncbi:ATP-binding protein [Actinomadura sp. 21ATH]|uniref:ATP-binding protein n=1 Tax=Actinomadura sp. 21ATH TaxID=1735444 RepID=UPI0035BFC4FC
MSGIDLMREAALLAAACHLAEPAGQVPAADAGWSAQPQARAELGRRLEAHERAPDPIRRRLMEDLGLPAPAYWLVMLCAAAELYPEAAAAVSLLTEDARQQLPTPTVLARLLRGIRGTPYRQALAAALGGGRARGLELVEAQETPAGVPHSQQPLRLTAAELEALTGEDDPGAAAGADPREAGRAGPGRLGPEGLGLEGFEAVVVPAQPVTGFGAEVVRPAQRLLERRGLLVLRGGSRRGRRQLACDLAGDRARAAALVTVARRPEQPVQLPGAARLARAAARSGGALVAIDLHPPDVVHPGVLDTLRRCARATPGLVVLVDESADVADLPVVDAPAVDHPAARRIWSAVLPEPQAEAMAARFRVGIDEALAAVREVADLLDGASPAPPPSPADDGAPREGPPADGRLGLLAQRVRAQGARRMGRYVSVVTSDARLADLVVSEPLAVQIREIIGWQRGGRRVRWDMALGAGDPVGTGLTCLFSGKSGTGKTFAARCLAGELGLNLYRIDLSQVVSKYIGETEKALAQIFDEVEAGHGLLLFDEADALFGRRSEVKDAHDRYANIEVGYLLQRLEAYDGIAILTTNLQGNMDAAFVRRLRFILHFPAPDRDLRRRLWERSLPGRRWREGDLRLDVLADRFQLSGGAIHNIGLAAAHLAAATPSGRITLAHLARATQRELLKVGRPADDAAFGRLVGTHTEESAPAGPRKGGPG